jgi:hypothetical protein
MSEFIFFNDHTGYLFHRTGKNLIAKFESIQRVHNSHSHFIVSRRIEYILNGKYGGQVFKTLYGIFDAEKNKFLIECIYNEMNTIGDAGKLLVKLNKYQGIIDLNGEIIVPIKYDLITCGIDENLYVCYKRAKCELFNVLSGKTTKLNYQKVIVDKQGFGFIVKRDLKWGICNSSFIEIIAPTYSDFLGQDGNYTVFLLNRKLVVLFKNEVCLELKSEKFHHLKSGVLVTKSNSFFVLRKLIDGSVVEFKADLLMYSQIYDCFVYCLVVGDYKDVETTGYGSEIMHYGIISTDLKKQSLTKLPDFMSNEFDRNGDVDSLVFYMNNSARFSSKNIIGLTCVDFDMAVLTIESPTSQVTSLVNSKGEYIIKEVDSTAWDDEEFEAVNEKSYTSGNVNNYDLELDEAAVDNLDFDNEWEEDCLEDIMDTSESSSSYSKQAVEPKYSAGVKSIKREGSIEETSNHEWYLWLIVGAVFILLFFTKPTFSDFTRYAKRDWASQYYEIGKQSDDEFVSACTRLVELSGVLSEAEDELWKNNCIDCLSFKNYGIFVIAKVDMSGYYKTYLGVFGSFYEL